MKIQKELIQTDFHSQHFDSIQALRGLAALFVVLEHIRFLNCGAFGVDIFFCISGFMIMFSTHQGGNCFLRKRLIRILPLYYLMTIGTFLLLLLFPSMFEQTRADPASLLKSLLFIPFDIGGGVVQPLMRIGWTVNCEIFFYLLFWISLRISHRYRGVICGALLLGVVGAAQILPSCAVLSPSCAALFSYCAALCSSCAVPLSFYGSPVMLEFLFGIAAYYAAQKLYTLRRRQKLPRVCLPLSALIITGCFLGLVMTKPRVNILGFGRPLLWGLPALAIVLGTFVLGLFFDRMPHPAVLLGDASFSLYLIHYYPVMLLDRAVFDFSACTPYSLPGALAAVLVSICLALISHALIEKRFTGWLRKLLIR